MKMTSVRFEFSSTSVSVNYQNVIIHRR